MSFDGVQSTINMKTRKLSAIKDEDLPIANRSTVEIKNELGSSEVSEDQKSYAMSLELLTSQIAQKKQQLQSQKSKTESSPKTRLETLDIQQRSRSNSGSDIRDDNPIVCFSASESDEMELSDS